MSEQDQTKDLLEQLKENPPKVIGGYKKQGWAVKVLENISNETIEFEEDGTVTAKSILLANDETYYPAFLTLDMENKGQVIGAYLISEEEDQFILIPFEIAKDFLNKSDEELLPLKYRTLEKIEGDEIQQNWPEFI
ncbi:hypothetical protein [Bacillus massilinigeriensis]|uniref:hypothetical protein n=1 Tax=Bacillus massilionigeriensis TaxID=1805475 RepID=UPI00096B24BD|nr:hypothetical protein [Bacillus massilionigeriensis]